MTTGTAHALVSLVLPAWVDWLKKPCYSTLISDQTIFLNHHCQCQHLVIISHAQCSMHVYFLCWCVCCGLVIQRHLQSWWHRVSGATNMERLMATPTILIWGNGGSSRSWGIDLSLPACLYMITNCTRIELQKYWGRYWSVMDAQQSFGAGEKQIENW